MADNAKKIMLKNLQINPAAEFQALPLESIISAPLSGAIRAQAAAAESTLRFIEAFKSDKVDFSIETQTDGKPASAKISAPLLSMIPVPHMRIDSLSVTFHYEISQVAKWTVDNDISGGGNIGAVGPIAKFVNVSLNGNVSHKTSKEASTNRSGSLEITMHASEAPIPEGLARILSLLARSIPEASPEKP